MGFERQQILNRREIDIRKFLCAECTLCLESPVRCTICLRNFCYDCIFTRNRVEGELVTGWCPVDKQPVKDEDIIECSREIQDLETRLLANCRLNSEHGSFSLKEVVEHEATCSSL